MRGSRMTRRESFDDSQCESVLDAFAAGVAWARKGRVYHNQAPYDLKLN